MLKAGHGLCLLLRSTGIPEGQCEELREEQEIAEPKDMPDVVSDEATLETHRLESEKYEATKQAEWAALADTSEQDPEALEKDPDAAGGPESGYPHPGHPQRLGETPSATVESTQQHIQKLVDESVKVQKPMVTDALNSILLAIKQGVFHGKTGAKKAEGVVGMVIRIRKQIIAAFKEDRKAQTQISAGFTNRTDLIMDQLVTQQQKQDRLTAQIDALDNKTIKATELLDWGEAKTTEAAQSLKSETERCAGVKERIRLRNAERREALTRIHAVHEQIAMKPVEAPYCQGGCGTDNQGTCVAFDDKPASCLCNPGFYGEHCQSKMCPGFSGGLFPADMKGACNGGVCNATKGICASCEEGEYSGVNKACELKKCPSVDCSGHGQCQSQEGKCKCEEGWSGDKCEHNTCPGPDDQKYPAESHNACYGRGICNTEDGTCECQAPFMGYACQNAGCLNDCTGHGKCDARRGKCVCDQGFSGPACELKKCPDNCSGHGRCSRLSGWCECDQGYTGDACKQAKGCEKQIADWWVSFDNEGWALCPKGSLLQGLYRNDCEGLACVESAQCVKPCEGDKPIVPNVEVFFGETGRCYHHTWHDSFDKKGWSRCNEGFYLAGVYRSHQDGLFGLQQAKCCEISGNMWHDCTEADWSVSWKGKGWSAVPRNKFITGFYRGDSQALSSITKASGCGFTHAGVVDSLGLMPTTPELQSKVDGSFEELEKQGKIPKS